MLILWKIKRIWSIFKQLVDGLKKLWNNWNNKRFCQWLTVVPATFFKLADFFGEKHLDLVDIDNYGFDVWDWIMRVGVEGAEWSAFSFLN